MKFQTILEILYRYKDGKVHKTQCLQRSGQDRKLVFMSPLCLITIVFLLMAKFKFVRFPY